MASCGQFSDDLSGLRLERFITPDTDEGIADVYQAQTTESIRSSILDYPIEHGRRYHAFKPGTYHRPNDEDELNRLEITTAICNIVNNGQLFQAPVTPHRVLDLGAGTGSWCIDMGDAYPAADIFGVDISATLPSAVPPNVTFEIDDIEDRWTYDQPFDLIHARYLAGAIKDWPRLVAQSFQHLKPGGFVEFQDWDFTFRTQDGSLREDAALWRWQLNGFEAARRIGRSLWPGRDLERWVREAGFVDVQVVRSPMPLGPWPKDPLQKRLGMLNWANMWEGLQGFSLRLYLDVLGYQRGDLEMLLMQVRQDMQTPEIHCMSDMYTVWGRKPGYEE